MKPALGPEPKCQEHSQTQAIRRKVYKLRFLSHLGIVNNCWSPCSGQKQNVRNRTLGRRPFEWMFATKEAPLRARTEMPESEFIETHIWKENKKQEPDFQTLPFVYNSDSGNSNAALYHGNPSSGQGQNQNLRTSSKKTMDNCWQTSCNYIEADTKYKTKETYRS